MNKSRRLAYLALTITAIIWGAALPIVKPSLSYISPTQFLFFRYLLATPLLIPFLIHHWRKLKPSKSLLSKIIALELIGTPIALLVLYEGLAKTSALEASLIATTGPIFITLGGIIFLKEKEESREWLGLGLSFLGTLILVLEPLLTGNGHTLAFSLSGNMLVILYNLIWASYLLIAKGLYKKIPKIFISSFTYPLSLIFFFILLNSQGVSTPLTLLQIPEVLTAALYMAIPGSIVAFTLYIYGQNLIEASEASLFSYIHGIVAIPASYLILGDVPTPYMLLGIIVIATGVLLAEYRTKKFKK